jgi:hypothetical protein
MDKELLSDLFKKLKMYHVFTYKSRELYKLKPTAKQKT